MYYRTVPTRTRGRGGGCSGRLLIAAAIAAFSLFSYFSSRQDNPVTGAAYSRLKSASLPRRSWSARRSPTSSS